DNEFKTALKSNNLYRKNALCKFLLGAIENQGKTQLIIDNLTIEHILPQNKNLSSSWQQMLGDNWADIQNQYVHTLGNLTLTAYNSELGDKPFVEKNKLLSDANSQVVYLYKDVSDRDQWNESRINARAERLSNDIIKLFKIDDQQTTISFFDPRYKEYTCENPDDATWKVPNYFVLQGERVATTSFAEMLKSVVDRLYEIDSTIIEELARNNAKIVDWSQNVLFSYDANITKGQDLPVKDSGIYQSTGFSASNIIYIICALLDKYDIPHEDFVYSARDSKMKS
ncbi:MAG: HNH endonuclease, partial [Clostridia bacterium]|nr:HNH endonuclease [Clostridia bacterium]